MASSERYSDAGGTVGGRAEGRGDTEAQRLAFDAPGMTRYQAQRDDDTRPAAA